MPFQDNESITLPSSLDHVKIKSLPRNAYYIADFITEAEEETILNKIATAPKPRWKTLAHRRLQTWPSDLNNDILLYSPLPGWLIEPVIPRLLAIPKGETDNNNNIFSNSPHHVPNHVLVNEYLPGQGIMPHKDGSAYYPVVCTVSLGASLCLSIYGSKEDGTTETQPRWKILQEPRSLLITTDDLYSEYLHGIADVKADLDLSYETVANWSLLRSRDDFAQGVYERKTRISLTYRDVLKVSKLGSKFGVLGRR